MSFAERLDRCVDRSGSLLCVGLDPGGAASAAEAEAASVRLVESTLEHAVAFKPNLAFFERFGSAGYAVLERLRVRVPETHIYVLDAKRSDLDRSAAAYAEALFDALGADAITVNPLMGADAVTPYLRGGRGTFLLTRTSNPGAADLLEAPLSSGAPLHERIVEMGVRLDPGGDVGFVVGATAPAAVARVRELAPQAPLLLPGVGAQGGSLQETVRAAAAGGSRRLLLSVSRGIAAAAAGPAAAAAAYRQQISAALEAAPAA